MMLQPESRHTAINLKPRPLDSKAIEFNNARLASARRQALTIG